MNCCFGLLYLQLAVTYKLLYIGVALVCLFLSFGSQSSPGGLFKQNKKKGSIEDFRR